jgi:NAD dependent epimerase/dehydratase family enzyme
MKIVIPGGSGQVGTVLARAFRPLMQILRSAYGTSFGLPATKWMLEIGAVFLRTETELILKSRRVVPTRLLEHGFTFKHPEWPIAAQDLCRQWRAVHESETAA